MQRFFKGLVAMLALAGSVVTFAQETACDPDQNKVAEAAMV